MGSTLIDIPEAEGVVVPCSKQKTNKFVDICCRPMVSFLRETKNNRHGLRKVIHSVKVGLALVTVSLLFLLDPLYKGVGENAMWAIMTVVLIFEFFAGATLSKGVNRGIGTTLGGGLGCLAAALAQAVGGVGKAMIVGITVFIFGAAATYTRQVPKLKRRFDYGAMIFILTFNLVVVSGLRAEQVFEIARDRLSAIAIGFAVCLFVSLLVFPIWAGDELHDSVVSRFELLAISLQGFSKEYFGNVDENEKKTGFNFGSKCKSVLHTKTKDETLVNFAKWEPCHGKFGIFYPWGKYLTIGEDLRDLATIILSLKPCLKSTIQPSENSTLGQSVKEPCEAIVASQARMLSELGESMKKMKKCESEDKILLKLKSMRQELSLVATPSTVGINHSDKTEGLGLASFVYSMMEMIEKMEELAKQVEQLGQLGGFS
ncbi:aluminum-activated, malate transporter 12, quick-activating anion channel 1 [Hibiscus trionum]|uniref:Aluminum-activated, malate transporter 12, quick-activating anion channel 1 n=1 Tax=Hibiscus trionum TaxID=183268 RepID=A0A9W7J6M9_HIBTR|nr:aluminum-activated, malate transporter 12, quick-activating anion channel 1 [Hibiscus trionum]